MTLHQMWDKSSFKMLRNWERTLCERQETKRQIVILHGCTMVQKGHCGGGATAGWSSEITQEHELAEGHFALWADPFKYPHWFVCNGNPIFSSALVTVHPLVINNLTKIFKHWFCHSLRKSVANGSWHS